MSAGFSPSATSRSSIRSIRPPGGGSSIIFGDSPVKAPPPVLTISENGPAFFKDDKENVPDVLVLRPGKDEAKSLDTAKIQAISLLVGAGSEDELKEALQFVLREMDAAEGGGPGVFPGEPQTVGGMEGQSRAPTGGPVDMLSQVALEQLRQVLKGRGCHGIFSLGAKFRGMDDDGNKQLSFEEFSKAMAELGIDQSGIHAMFRYFDADCSGSVSFDEFLEGVRGELNERRRALVLLAFKVLDKDGSGVVELNDVLGRYDVSQHPDVVSGVKTKSQVLREFMDVFDGGVKDGSITPEEFAKYYSHVSCSIDDDDYFELVVRNAWHISGGEGWSENTTCRRLLVTHEDGHQSVEEIQNDFDIGSGDQDAMKASLAQRGINAKSVALYGSIEDPTPASPTAAGAPSTTGSMDFGRPRSSRGSYSGRATQSSIVF